MTSSVMPYSVMISIARYLRQHSPYYRHHRHRVDYPNRSHAPQTTTSIDHSDKCLRPSSHDLRQYGLQTTCVVLLQDSDYKHLKSDSMPQVYASQRYSVLFEARTLPSFDTHQQYFAQLLAQSNQHALQQSLASAYCTRRHNYNHRVQNAYALPSTPVFLHQTMCILIVIEQCHLASQR